MSKRNVVLTEQQMDDSSSSDWSNWSTSSTSSVIYGSISRQESIYQIHTPTAHGNATFPEQLVEEINSIRAWFIITSGYLHASDPELLYKFQTIV